jgi:fructose-1,6-bisphosphatase
MLCGRTNVTKFLIEEQRRNPALVGDFSMLISDVVRSCKAIAQGVSRGSLANLLGDAGSRNIQGEGRRSSTSWPTRLSSTIASGVVICAAMASEEMEDIFRFPRKPARQYLLVFDPLDGSSNIDVNLSVGSIFSVFAAPRIAVAACRVRSIFCSLARSRWQPAMPCTDRRRCSC